MKNPFAFPLQTVVSPDSEVQDGMTLRDYMAAKAMKSMVRLQSLDNIEYHQRAVAMQAYRMADAMLAEREKSHVSD